MDSLAGALDLVSSAFEERTDEMASVVAARSREEIPELHDFEAPQFWEAVRGITRGSRHSQAEHLRHGCQLPIECPGPDVDAARLATQARVSLPGSLKSYRIGHAVGWETWLDGIEQAELSGSARQECVRVISRFVDAYDDRLMELFTAEYLALRDQHRSGSRRLAAIRQVLDGTAGEAADLDYDLALDHLAVIARGVDAALSLRRLAGVLDRRLLMAEVSEHVYWAWLGSPSSLAPAELEQLTRFDTAGSMLCVGNPEPGPDGFRHSHRQAGDAYVVALSCPQPVTLYADVALEALALRDESVARDFARCQLRALDGDDRLRETLRRYFASSQNAAATAAAMNVHEQTVARRLRAAELKLGCPLNRRRAELELALRLEELLEGPPGAPLAPGSGRART